MAFDRSNLVAGNTILVNDTLQIIKALEGDSGAAQPISLTAVNSSSLYALDVQNDDVGSKALRVRNSSGTTLLDTTFGGMTMTAATLSSPTLAGTITVSGAITSTNTLGLTVASTTALTVARTGSNYALQVDTNTASAATGVKVTAAAAGNGVALAAISSGTNETLTIDAKGSGFINLATSSTGGVGIGTTGQTTVGLRVAPTALIGSSQTGVSANPTATNAATGNVIALNARAATAALSFTCAAAYGVYVSDPSKGAGSAITSNYGMWVESMTQGGTNNYGVYINVPSGGGTNNIGLYNAGTTKLDGVATLCAATATPANGSTSARLLFGTTAGFGIYYGSSTPSVSAAQGSLYLRSDGTNGTSRAYINTDGAGTWTAINTVA